MLHHAKINTWKGKEQICSASNVKELEEGQVKMQSRLEEEEEAKAALMSRIQRLTKLILVSSKSTIPGLSDLSSHQRSLSVGEDDKLDVLRDGSLLMDSGNQKDSPSSVLGTDPYEFKHRKSSSKWNDDLSTGGSTITESIQAGELISGSSCGSKLPIGGMTMSDQMDLLVEQVKMLVGEIAFSTSTLKRLMEQTSNDPESFKTQCSEYENLLEINSRIPFWLCSLCKYPVFCPDIRIDQNVVKVLAYDSQAHMVVLPEELVDCETNTGSYV